MSKILKAIEMGRRQNVYLPYRFSIETTATPVGFPMPHGYLHAIRLQFSSQVVLDPALGDENIHAIQNAKEMLARMAFDEYVMPLHEALHAIHNRDLRRARLIISSVLENFLVAEEYKLPPEVAEKSEEIAP